MSRTLIYYMPTGIGEIMIFGMSIYQILWYFMIYSVIGWIIEVSFHAVTLGKVVNRGFLNGPLCPVYGSGVLTVHCSALKPIFKRLAHSACL